MDRLTQSLHHGGKWLLGLSPRRLFAPFLGAVILGLLGHGIAKGWKLRWIDYGAGDWLGYWSVAHALLRGRGFFDLAWLEALQRAHGYNFGMFLDWAGFIHYYPVIRLWNPPPLLTLFLPLGGPGLTVSVLLWLTLIFGLYGLAALCFNRTLPHPLPPVIALGLPFLCLPFIVAVYFGQLGPALGALLVFAWTLQRRGHDFAAGVLLAPLLLKPQLSFVALGLMVWMALRERRWATLGGFGGHLAALTALAFLLDPTWVAGWNTQGRPLDWLTVAIPDLLQLLLRLPPLFQYAGVPLMGALAWWRHRNAPEISPRILGESVIFSLLGSPYHWNHDVTVLLPVVLWIGAAFWHRGWRRKLLGLTLWCILMLPFIISPLDLLRYLIGVGTIVYWWRRTGNP